VNQNVLLAIAKRFLSQDLYQQKISFLRFALFSVNCFSCISPKTIYSTTKSKHCNMWRAPFMLC